MSEFGKLCRAVTEFEDYLKVSRLCQRCDAGEWCAGASAEVQRALDMWRGADVDARVRKLEKKLEGDLYGDAMKAKVVAFVAHAKEGAAAVKKLAAWKEAAGATDRRERFLALPPSLSGWTEVACAQVANLAAVAFIPQDSSVTKGVLRLLGPKYTAFYGHGWTLELDLVSRVVINTSLPADTERQVRLGVASGGLWGDACLATLAGAVTALMRQPLSRTAETAVREKARSYESFLARRKRAVAVARALTQSTHALGSDLHNLVCLFLPGGHEKRLYTPPPTV